MFFPDLYFNKFLNYLQHCPNFLTILYFWDDEFVKLCLGKLNLERPHSGKTQCSMVVFKYNNPCYEFFDNLVCYSSFMPAVVTIKLRKPLDNNKYTTFQIHHVNVDCHGGRYEFLRTSYLQHYPNLLTI